MDIIAICLLCVFGFMAVPGVIKIAEEIYELMLVGRGYLKVFLFYPNKRFSYWYAKPKVNQISVKGGTYDFVDDSDFMPTMSGMFSSMPAIFLDTKTKTQIKMCNQDVPKGEKDPRAADGAGKLAWAAGFLEGAGDMKNVKLFFLIIMIAVVALAAIILITKSGLVGG